MMPDSAGSGISVLNPMPCVASAFSFSEGAKISHIEPAKSKPISGYTSILRRLCRCCDVSGCSGFASFGEETGFLFCSFCSIIVIFIKVDTVLLLGQV